MLRIRVEAESASSVHVLRYVARKDRDEERSRDLAY